VAAILFGAAIGADLLSGRRGGGVSHGALPVGQVSAAKVRVTGAAAAASRIAATFGGTRPAMAGMVLLGLNNDR
jgi:hypothetical protein